MKLTIAAVADHAWVENGCLSLIRAFDTINAPQFPFQLPRLSIALRFLIRRTEIGVHKLNIVLCDSDGKKLLNANLDVNVQIPPESNIETSYSFALNGQNIVFHKQGDHVVDIIVDSDHKASIPIYVKGGQK